MPSKEHVEEPAGFSKYLLREMSKRGLSDSEALTVLAAARKCPGKVEDNVNLMTIAILATHSNLSDVDIERIQQLSTECIENSTDGYQQPIIIEENKMDKQINNCTLCERGFRNPDDRMVEVNTGNIVRRLCVTCIWAATQALADKVTDAVVDIKKLADGINTISGNMSQELDPEDDEDPEEEEEIDDDDDYDDCEKRIPKKKFKRCSKSFFGKSSPSERDRIKKFEEAINDVISHATEDNISDLCFRAMKLSNLGTYKINCIISEIVSENEDG